jgi:membrane protein YdbS with pleckstrin-like domain
VPDIYVAKKPKSSKKRKKPAVAKAMAGKEKPSNFDVLTKSLKKMGIKPGTYPLGAFVALPKKVSFETQEKKEKIVLLLRRHWLTNLSWALGAGLMSIAPFFLRASADFKFLPFRFQVIGVIMWYLFVLIFVFEKFLSWFFNVYIITDERIIDVDFYSLIYREISQAKIDRIQDITFKSGGLLMAAFDYGDVYIQTAGETQQIEFEAVPHPNRVVKVLNRLIMEEEKEKIEGRIR